LVPHPARNASRDSVGDSLLCLPLPCVHPTSVLSPIEGASVPDAIAAVKLARSGKGGAVLRSILSSLLHEAGVGLSFAWMISHYIQSGPHFLPAVPFLLYIEPWILLGAAWVGLLMSLAACRWHLHRSLGSVLLLSYFAYMLYNIMVVSPLATR